MARYGHPVITREDEFWRVEILHEGKSISRLWIVDRQLRIGRAIVSSAGIAGVGTDSAHRKQGLALRVLRFSLEWMRAEGYDTSFLFGIEDFYHRVGFATCFPDHGLSIDTRQAEKVRSRLRTRPMKEADLPAVRKLYEGQNRTRTAAAVRARSWSGFSMGSGFGVPCASHVVYATGAKGRALGYVLFDDVSERCRIAEVGGDGDDVNGAIVRLAGQRAVELRRERISASVPADHPFAVYCRRLGMHDETRYPRNAGAMGRVLNMASFLTSLAPELAACWPQDAPQQLTIRAGDQIATLTHRRGQVTAQSGGSRALQVIDGGVLMQLAMGYRDADDAIGAGDLRGTGPQKDLARALFPLRVGHMWWPDRF